MAAIHHFAPAQTSPSAFAVAVATLVSGIRAISRALKNRRDANMLAGMDDRMLADIGLTRSDLRDAYAHLDDLILPNKSQGRQSRNQDPKLGLQEGIFQSERPWRAEARRYPRAQYSGTQN